MAGKKRSGLANDKRAYGCGICYPPQTQTPTPTPPTPTPTPPTPIPTPTPNTTILEYLSDQFVTSFTWGTVVFTRDTSLPGFCYTTITSGALPFPASTTSPIQNVAQISSITIGNTVTSIGASAFFGGTNSTSLTFTPTSTLISIGANAFQNCFSDPSISTSITIPNSVTSIGTNAFRNCDSLVSVILPTNPSFTSIGTSVFQACDTLTSVTIPNSVTSIGISAFFGCPVLSTIIIPSSVISIGNTAFRLCIALSSITIPLSVTSIGTNAFQSSGLTNVTLLQPSQTISGIPYTAPSTVAGFFGQTSSVNINI